MSLEEDLGQLARRSNILVALDFDGTLSEIVPRPEDARPAPGAVEAIVELSRLPGVQVAIVSGRGIDDLVTLVGDIEGISLVAEHGAVWHGQPAPEPARHAEVRTALEEVTADVPGAWVEVKQTAFSLHSRAVTDANAEEELIRKAEAALEPIVPGRFDRGLHVLDVRLAGSTKADAVRILRRDVDAVLFVGDDTTDESVFLDARPVDLMVKVGMGDTAALHRVTGPEHVVGLLRTLVRSRDSVPPTAR